ncbi:protein MEMO1 isoform X1 [Hydra vulgaris]|uniref:Protein MEMO1 n=1 Tax=Hydra vulgaris TaxID=6087 RepID=T2M2F3_HYDVU|nr:protein MEMO1 [Hydra vulgaris]
MSFRRASHAGSWYSDSGDQLNKQLEQWLSEVNVKSTPARALISPHAGYAYCGACAAYAYKQINPMTIKRIFILGPSHHVALPGCAVTQTTSYETPLYNLKIDNLINNELLGTGKFDIMSKETDENEHSIEMQLPFIAKVMESNKDNFTVVPILVGSTSHEQERLYGVIFSKYLKNPENLFVISSDFCHWGKRFRFTPYDKSKGEIYESIEDLDKMGMKYIEQLDTNSFYKYLEKFSNTICGRHPIGILLNAVNEVRSADASFKFHYYSQSSKCRRFEDSSVSYAAGTLTQL